MCRPYIILNDEVAERIFKSYEEIGYRMLTKEFRTLKLDQPFEIFLPLDLILFFI